MRGERRLDAHGTDLEALPDRELVDVAEALAAQERAEPARDDERRRPSDPLERPEVEVVVMGVREEHGVDPAQRVAVRSARAVAGGRRARGGAGR